MTKSRLKTSPFWAIAMVAALGMGLTACGGGGSDDAGAPPPMIDPEPTAYETASAAIAAAGTAEAAQAAVDNAAADVSGTELRQLQMAADERKDVLAAMARADDQRTSLMRAAGMIDTSDLSTQEAVDAAQTAIVGLRQAIADAVDVDDTSMYQSMLDTAVAAVDDAQDGIDTDARRTNQMAALESASDALKTAGATLAGAQTRANLDAAKDAQGDLNTALDEAVDLTEAEKAEAQGVADAAAGQIGGAETAVAKAEADAKEKQRIAEQAVKNAASMKVAAAINAHTTAGDPPAEFAFADTRTPPQILTVTRGSGAAKITPYQSSADEKMKPFAKGTAPDAGTGWSGMTFMRSGTASKRPYTEMAAVYTDIEMAKDALWTEAFDGVTGLAQSAGVVTITANTASVNASHFTGGILPIGPTGNDDTSTVNLSAGQGRLGSFYGVSGRFSCAADCIVTRDDKGVVRVSSDMVFTPNGFDADTTMAKYADPDEDYTQFGYWMKSTKQRDGSYTHDIETFHGGSASGTGTGLATITDIEGTAEYYGAAAGVYVKKEGAGDTLVVSDGKFTADAMLTARFGGTTIAARDHNTVTGTISDFMDGSTNLGFANLELRDGTIVTADGTPADTVAGQIINGETDGGGTSGNWSGQFRGNAGSSTTTALSNGRPAASDDFPQNVSGEFDGHFSNGHVAGAFGAEKD